VKESKRERARAVESRGACGCYARALPEKPAAADLRNRSISLPLSLSIYLSIYLSLYIDIAIALAENPAAADLGGGGGGEGGGAGEDSDGAADD
jgi:hypothetical protein